MIKVRKRLERFSAPVMVLVVVLALGLLLPCVVLARAGGGDRFPTGGGGGMGGGGGDNGLFYIIFYVLLSRLPWPLKILAIVVIVVVMGAWKKKRGARRAIGGYESSPAPAPLQGYTPAASPGVTDQLADLKGRDPAFSRQQFEDMASTAFFRIQEAWSGRDMSRARPFLSPSLYQRFEAQIAELKKMGRTNHLEQAVVASLDIAEAMHDGGYDYVTARIQAAAADYTVDDKSGQLVSGSKEVRAFTEYWTFLRSDAVKTEPGRELIVSRHCPNCGAPISLNAVGKCDYCASDVTSGAFSWVLSEITQESAWRPRARAARPREISPLAGQRYVLGLVQCPQCGANVQDIAGVTAERCWRCGATVHTQK